jgi:hypothetical protein
MKRLVLLRLPMLAATALLACMCADDEPIRAGVATGGASRAGTHASGTGGTGGAGSTAGGSAGEGVGGASGAAVGGARSTAGGTGGVLGSGGAGDSAMGGSAGTPCGTGKACQPSDEPCLAGVVNCDTGVARCQTTTVPANNGTQCGTDRVCYQGICSACVAGGSCSSGICRLGQYSCASGYQTCRAVGPNPDANGQICGTGHASAMICKDGSCTCASSCHGGTGLREQRESSIGAWRFARLFPWRPNGSLAVLEQSSSRHPAARDGTDEPVASRYFR